MDTKITRRISHIANRAISSVYSIVGNEKANYPRQVNVTGANTATLDFIKSTDCKMIAEVGIYKGHTSIEIADILNGEGELHLFDYHDRVQEVAEAINAKGHNNVKTFGCSYKTLDSYNWPLAKLLRENEKPIYDYVFIDGAHTFAVDALAFVIADRLLKVGGYMDFDDYDWTLNSSPTLNPGVFPITGKMYTDEQIKSRQVKMVIDLFVRRSENYKEVVENKIFQKI